MEKLLVINCGSSSLKYEVYAMPERMSLGKGLVERIGASMGTITQKSDNGVFEAQEALPDHDAAMALVKKALTDEEHGILNSIREITGVGHRTVHAGEDYASSVVITDDVIDAIKRNSELAPLHNPANLMGIEAAMEMLPGVSQVAVFDTAFHQTLAPSSYLYGLPRELYTKYKIRRYGFHGTSHRYVSSEAVKLMKRSSENTNVISCHLGNGASITAIRQGKSVETSMGFTPLEGLVMGTRSGDIDPAIPFFIMDKTGMSASEVEKALNKESGVLGITEKWIDRRDIEIAAEEGNPRAIVCQLIESYRIKKYIGAYSAAIGGPDAIVFTAGVGERGPITRKLALEGLEYMGVKIDDEKNYASMTRNAETCISTDDSKVKVFVIPTNEELVMTEDTYALLEGTYDVHTNYEYHFESADYVNKEREAGLPKDLKKWKGLDKTIVTPPKKEGGCCGNCNC